MLTRRQLVQRGAIGGAGLLLSRGSLAIAAPTTVGATPKLRKWRDALPVPPVLDGRGGGKSFRIAARESTDWKFHPDLPATRTWGYWSDNPRAGLPYLGQEAAEITAMGMLPEWHRRGIGRALVEEACRFAVDQGARLLQVKTLGPSHPSEHYARTRTFYETLGSIPLEETTSVWGAGNPCLILVRILS